VPETLAAMSSRRAICLLSAAILVSALGDFLAVIPLALRLEHDSGSGIVVAGLFIALWTPVALLAAPAGLLVDRVDPRRALIAVSAAQALVAVGLAFADSTAAILALTALLGCGVAVANPAEFALVPGVAGSDAELKAANGRIESARYLGYTLGPLLGGALAAGGGTQIALLIDAASFVFVALVAIALRPRPRAVAEHEDLGRARDGIVFLVRDRVLAVVIAVAFTSLLFMTASAAAEVFFATDVLGAGDLGYGVLMTAWTAGMVLGATTLPRRVPAVAAATVALVAIAVQGAGLALPTLWLSLAFALVAYVVGGSAQGLKNVLIRTLIHERVPERLHGRAYAAYNGLRNGAELVALAGGGLLVSAIGARSTLLLAGALPVLAALAGLAARRAPRLVPVTT
jgi:Na+/melibiose symporter-like transporter